MCANRGEIAVRVFRAAAELGKKTVGIFSRHEPMATHRWKCDEAFAVGGPKSKPVGAYLDIKDIIRIALENDVDAIHPGYGFLSESAPFAKACEDAGIIFIGPSSDILTKLGDKVQARKFGEKAGISLTPGSEPVKSVEHAINIVEGTNGIGYPVIIKAAMGGGGRGMRVANNRQELERNVGLCKSEALKGFGDDTVFIEVYIQNPRHVEVQILGDRHGNLVHAYERDCTVQRRHQKVVEIAPAFNLDDKIRQGIIEDAVKLTKHVSYNNAGTVEFLIDGNGKHYFMEVNPRIQVEHTVTEQITGIDLVQSQILIAEGASLEKDLNIRQSDIKVNGFAIQGRVTTEDPKKDFQPESGVLDVFKTAEGNGIRLDGIGAPGYEVTDYYDSLLAKVTGYANTYDGAVNKLRRALEEFKVGDVPTNIPFIVNVLNHKDFLKGEYDTSFIENNPELLQYETKVNSELRGILKFLAEQKVNGSMINLVNEDSAEPSKVTPIVPQFVKPEKLTGFRDILLSKGKKAFQKAIRDHKGLLLTDTTWRDAHQSLLATRVRTKDLLAVAEPTAITLQNAFSLEMWGGATFDVCMRFLHESPWDRLAELREKVPHIPFQMLLRSSNAVGYTSYADNVVYKFCEEANKHGLDVFRIFDSLNYVENLKLGIAAVNAAGGVSEASICYTGDIMDEKRKRYPLEYYLALSDEIVELDIDILNVKDMAGLLKPRAATKLIGALRKRHPDIPIHVHTHDTGFVGVASMIAAAHAGADAVDCALDTMSGSTSQPSLGAIVSAMANTPLDTNINLAEIDKLNDYWAQARKLYAPFEINDPMGGCDVFEHEIPGGQYSNMFQQASQLGIADKWTKIKSSYADANSILGDIIKVTPSSKVVGDLAQKMVAENKSKQEVLDDCETFPFPASVIDYLQGNLGEPHYGFPEPFRTKVLAAKNVKKIKGRPGKHIKSVDFDELHKDMQSKFGRKFSSADQSSYSLYDKVTTDFINMQDTYGDLSVLPTRPFLWPMDDNEKVELNLKSGKTFIKLIGTGTVDEDTGKREVLFSVNGTPRSTYVIDKKASTTKKAHPKADPKNPGQVAISSRGVITGFKFKVGDLVNAGDVLATLEAMKMESPILAPLSGKITSISATTDTDYEIGDLLLEIQT